MFNTINGRQVISAETGLIPNLNEKSNFYHIVKNCFDPSKINNWKNLLFPTFLQCAKVENIALRILASFSAIILDLITLPPRLLLKAFSLCYNRNGQKFEPVVSNVLPINEKNAVNQKIVDQVTEMFVKKAKDVYWIPHPKFVKEDEVGPFPANKINLFNFHGKEAAMLYNFRKGKDSQLKHEDLESNHFLKWLNNEHSLIEKKAFYSSDKMFVMNCTDFVFLNLYHAGLISKKKIIEAYRNQIKADLNPSSKYYGLDLNLFKEFDVKNPSEDGSPKPGDILLGFENGVCVHMLFLSNKNPVTGVWQGAGLWDRGWRSTCEDLTELAKNSNSPLTFKYCPLRTFLGIVA